MSHRHRVQNPASSQRGVGGAKTESSTPITPAATATPRLLFTNAVTHRIQATDTLATIAEAYYGAQRHWRLIYEANRTLIGDDPNAIPVGAELMIPPLAE